MVGAASGALEVAVQGRRRATLHRLGCFGASVAMVGVAACSSSSGSDSDSEPDAPEASTIAQVEGEDILSSVEVTPGPNSRLSAVVEAETTTDAVVSVELDTSESVGDPPETDTGTAHSVPVVGMRAETTYELTVRAEGIDGAEETVSVDWTTGSLPAGFPEITVDEADTEAMAPGVTLFEAMSWAGPDEDDEDDDSARNSYLIAVDGEGEVIWYYEAAATMTPVNQTAEGTFLVSANDSTIREIDVLGNTLRDLSTNIAYDVGTDLSGHELTSDDSEPIEIDSAHHELFELDSGNIITLSTELIDLDEDDAAELCPDEPETDIVGDVVVELSPEGEVVQEWPLSDVYDPVERPGAEMCVEQMAIAPPSWFYPEAQGTRDWTHGNAVVLDEEGNRLLVSLRHLDAVVALRYQDDEDGPAGELLWEIGPEGDLDMVGDGEWNYHQHDPDLEDDGTILLYDNGNLRPGTTEAGGDDPPFSRAVLFAVDEEEGTVTQLWEHRDESADGSPEYTQFLSGVDRLDNGSVLVTHGGGRNEEDTLYGRVVEVVPGDEADGSADEVVMDMTVTSEGAGWTIYRANRRESLYGTGEPTR